MEPGWDEPDGPRSLRGRRDLALRVRHAHRGRLLALRPPRDGLPRLPRAAHADHDATSARSWRRRAGKPILYFPARHDHWLVQTGDGWAAHVAGAIGVSTDAQASWWGGKGIGHGPARPDRLLRRRHGARPRGLRGPLRRPDEHRGAGRLRERLGADLARGRGRARRPALGSAARHLAHARRPLAARPHGQLRPARRQPGARAARARGARRGRPRPRQDRRLRRLQRRADPRVRAPGRARSTPTASARA